MNRRLTHRLFALLFVLAALTIGLNPALAAKGGGKKGGGGSMGGGGKSSQSQSQTQQQPTPPTSNPAVGEIAKAEADMKAAEAAVRKTFESSPEWTAAHDAVTEAQKNYDTTKEPILASVKNSSDYKTASANVDKAEADMKAASEAGDGTSTDAASKLLAARQALHSIENSALSNDSNVSAAKDKLTAAVAAVTDLRKKENDAVQADPTWQAAKKALDDARAKLASSNG